MTLPTYFHCAQIKTVFFFQLYLKGSLWTNCLCIYKNYKHGWQHNAGRIGSKCSIKLWLKIERKVQASDRSVEMEPMRLLGKATPVSLSYQGTSAGISQCKKIGKQFGFCLLLITLAKVFEPHINKYLQTRSARYSFLGNQNGTLSKAN